MKSHLLSLVLFFALGLQVVSNAQDEICNTYYERFLTAVKAGSLSEIEFQYGKLTRACGVSPTVMGMLAGSFENKGAVVHWLEDQSFRVEGLLNPEINLVEYDGMVTFERLPVTSPIRQKFSSLAACLRAINVDESNLALEPVFLPKYQVFWIKEYGKDQLIHEKTLKNLVVFKENNGGLNYGGNGLFFMNLQEKTSVFSVRLQKEKPVVKNLLDVPGNARVFPVSTTKSYIVVENTMSESTSISLYSDEGVLLVKDLDLIVYNPLSTTFIFAKDNLGKLVNRKLETLVENAVYIEELINQDMSYFAYRNQADEIHVIDMHGKNRLAGAGFEIYQAPHPKYVLVEKENRFGAIDFATGNILVPFSSERIYELFPGFLTRMKDGNWEIFDEQATLLGTIPAVAIEPLTRQTNVLIKVLGENEKFGMYDLFGKQVLPAEYGAIEFDHSTQRIVVQSESELFYTDQYGNRIE